MWNHYLLEYPHYILGLYLKQVAESDQSEPLGSGAHIPTEWAMTAMW